MDSLKVIYTAGSAAFDGSLDTSDTLLKSLFAVTSGSVAGFGSVEPK